MDGAFGEHWVMVTQGWLAARQIWAAPFSHSGRGKKKLCKIDHLARLDASAA
jgi:hypothetical protein